MKLRPTNGRWEVSILLLSWGIWLVLFALPTLHCLAGTFHDDFEVEDDFLEDKQLRVGGVWGEDIGAYTWQDGIIQGRNLGNNWFLALITGDYGWSDYTVECKVKPIQTEDAAGFWWIGLTFRRPCIDCNPGYYFVFNQDTVQLRSQNGQLEAIPFEIELETWYTLRVVAEGKEIQCYIDDELAIELRDSTNGVGKAGVIVYHSIAHFDDFILTGPEVEDGGHWNPEAHPDPRPVSGYSRLATSWGDVKGRESLEMHQQ